MRRKQIFKDLCNNLVRFFHFNQKEDSLLFRCNMKSCGTLLYIIRWDATGHQSHAVVTMVAVGFFSRSMATAAAIFSSLAVWVRLRMMQLAWLI